MADEFWQGGVVPKGPWQPLHVVDEGSAVPVPEPGPPGPQGPQGVPGPEGPPGPGGGVSDGDKGDITVSASGTVFDINPGMVGPAELSVAYAPLASPALTGNPTAPTPAAADSTAKLATCAFVQGELATGLALKANLAGAAFTAGVSATGVTANAGPVIVDRVGDAANAEMVVRGDAGKYKQLSLQTGSLSRWELRSSPAAETGANAGSDFQMFAYDDAGASLGMAYTITRATRVMDFPVSPTSLTPAPGDNTTKLATTGFVAASFATTAAMTAADATKENLGTRRAVNLQTGATYTLALADAGQVVELNNAAAITLTVPLNATIAFPVGSWIDLIQYGAGQVTVSPAGGVTLRSAGSATKTRVRYSALTLVKRAADEWYLMGDLG